MQGLVRVAGCATNHITVLLDPSNPPENSSRCRRVSPCKSSVILRALSKAYSLMVPRDTAWVILNWQESETVFKLVSYYNTIGKSREGRPGQKSTFRFLKQRNWGHGGGSDANHSLIFLVYPSVLCGGFTLAGCQVHIKPLYHCPSQLNRGEKI